MTLSQIEQGVVRMYACTVLQNICMTICCKWHMFKSSFLLTWHYEKIVISNCNSSFTVDSLEIERYIHWYIHNIFIEDNKRDLTDTDLNWTRCSPFVRMHSFAKHSAALLCIVYDICLRVVFCWPNIKRNLFFGWKWKSSWSNFHIQCNVLLMNTEPCFDKFSN